MIQNEKIEKDENDYNIQSNNDIEKLDVHSDSDGEKADILDENVVTKGNRIDDINKMKGKSIYINSSGLTNMELHMKIREKLHKDIDWNEVKMNPNLINNDDKTIKIKRFKIELKNFADDCTLEMNPLLDKTQLTNYIKYGYRLNLQHSLNQFYNWTRYKRFVLSQPKCSSITFSRKRQ